jgi:hypothetical protein
MFSYSHPLSVGLDLGLDVGVEHEREGESIEFDVAFCADWAIKVPVGTSLPLAAGGFPTATAGDSGDAHLGVGFSAAMAFRPFPYRHRFFAGLRPVFSDWPVWAWAMRAALALDLPCWTSFLNTLSTLEPFGMTFSFGELDTDLYARQYGVAGGFVNQANHDVRRGFVFLGKSGENPQGGLDVGTRGTLR